MPRKKVIIVIVLAAAIGTLIGLAAFFSGRTNETSGGGGVRTFFPFGSTDRTDERTPDSNRGDGATASSESAGGTSSVSGLRELHPRSVAGLYSFEENGSVLVRFVERATGNVYEAAFDGTPPVRITNTTIPRIQEAHFLDQDTLIVQYLSEDNESVESFLATITTGTSTETGTLTGSFLPNNITSIAAAPHTDTAFFTLGSGKGSDALIASKDGALNDVALLPLSEWLTAWPKERTVTLTTKPSAFAFGFLYALDTRTGTLERLLGRKGGLTALMHPTESSILYGEGGIGTLALGILDERGGEERPLSLRTLPEKCAWSRINTTIVYCGVPESLSNVPYPDAWYQGTVSFSDSLWMLDTETDTATLLARPADVRAPSLDAIDLKLTPDEAHLVFIDKNDGHPWMFTLPQNSPELPEEN